MQAGLVHWETQLLALERDHQEVLSPKVRRALLLNVLPATLQARIFEHLDRLTTYAQVREKVVSLVQVARGADDVDLSHLNCEPCGQVQGWDDQWPGQPCPEDG